MMGSLVIAQAFDLALTLEMGQTFRWRRLGDEEVRDRDWGHPPERWRTGDAWYSGVLGPYLVQIRQMGDGVEYRVGGRDGELEGIDLSELRHDPVVARAVGTPRVLRVFQNEEHPRH